MSRRAWSQTRRRVALAAFQAVDWLAESELAAVIGYGLLGAFFGFALGLWWRP
jgi:hypothetical protein